MREFTMDRPRNLLLALQMLKDADQATCVLAGGTDILPTMRKGAADFHRLIDITLLGLHEITDCGDAVSVGATCTFKQLYQSETIQKHLPLLAKAAKSIGAVQTRGLATIGGNLCSAVPSLDSAPVLFALGAKLHLASLEGERVVSIDDFFVGPRRTVCKKEEVLTKIVVKKPAPKFAGEFFKFGRRSALSLSIVNVAVGLCVQEGVIEDIRSCIGACGPKPVRPVAVEGFAKGKPLEAVLCPQLVALIANSISPIDDIRASADYRRHLAVVLYKRALQAAFAQSETKGGMR